MKIGTIIYNRRKELGMTLEQVGKLVGVSKSTVRKWETGYIADIKRDKIAKLAEALKINPVVLINGNLSDDHKPLPNVLCIVGRDGRRIEKRLTDEQVKALEMMISQFPDVPDDL